MKPRFMVDECDTDPDEMQMIVTTRPNTRQDSLCTNTGLSIAPFDTLQIVCYSPRELADQRERHTA